MTHARGSGRLRAPAPDRSWLRVVVLAVVLLLTGCNDAPETVQEAAEPTASPSVPSATTTPSASASSAEPVASASASPSSDDYRYENFVTPSGNIRCSLVTGPDGDGVNCSIGDKEWDAPPQPADCDGDWGNYLYLTEEEAGFDCVYDAIDPVVPLPYGETQTLGRVACDSRETGVRCEHLDSKHGFELSKARYSLF